MWCSAPQFTTPVIVNGIQTHFITHVLSSCFNSITQDLTDDDWKNHEPATCDAHCYSRCSDQRIPHFGSLWGQSSVYVVLFPVDVWSTSHDTNNAFYSESLDGICLVVCSLFIVILSRQWVSNLSSVHIVTRLLVHNPFFLFVFFSWDGCTLNPSCLGGPNETTQYVVFVPLLGWEIPRLRRPALCVELGRPGMNNDCC